LNQADPSEAIRSDLILPEIESRFDVVDRKVYGGAVLHLALEHIVQNFDPANADDRCWIRTLAETESLLQQNGVLQSDFVVLDARKRSSLLTRLVGILRRWFRASCLSLS
jgi:hypothetical protein